MDLAILGSSHTCAFGVDIHVRVILDIPESHPGNKPLCT